MGLCKNVMCSFVSSHNYDLVSKLLQCLPQDFVNLAPNNDGKTPLFYAVMGGDIPMAELLIKYGAKYNDTVLGSYESNLRSRFPFEHPVHRFLEKIRSVGVPQFYDVGANESVDWKRAFKMQPLYFVKPH